MRVNVVNIVEGCRDDCRDARITVEASEVKTVDCRKRLVEIIVDCEHSGVCKYKEACK